MNTLFTKSFFRSRMIVIVSLLLLIAAMVALSIGILLYYTAAATTGDAAKKFRVLPMVDLSFGKGHTWRNDGDRTELNLREDLCEETYTSFQESSRLARDDRRIYLGYADGLKALRSEDVYSFLPDGKLPDIADMYAGTGNYEVLYKDVVVDATIVEKEMVESGGVAELPQYLKDAGISLLGEGEETYPWYIYVFKINEFLARNSAFPVDSDMLYVDIIREAAVSTPTGLEPGMRCLLYGSRGTSTGHYMVNWELVQLPMFQEREGPFYSIHLDQRYLAETETLLDRYIVLPSDATPDYSSLEAFVESSGLPAAEAERWYAIIQNCRETVESLYIVTTGDLERVTPFNTNTMHILEGRGIDTDDKEAVCVVSAELAQRQGVQLGDKLRMRLRDAQYTPEMLPPDGLQQWSIESPADSVEVFAEVEYEVVGIYKSMGWIDYRFPQYFNPGTIFVSAAATPKSGNEELNSWRTPQAMWGFYLKNPDDADAFLTSLPEDLRDSVRIVDQGYSHVKPLLAELRSNARTILLITLAVWLAVVGIFLFIHVFRAKHTMGTLRSLGMPKRKVFSVFLLACMALWLIGAVISGIASAFLYDKLEARAFQNVFQSGAYNQAFSDIGTGADQGTNPWTGETDGLTGDALMQRVYSAGVAVPRVLLSLGIQGVLFLGICALTIWLVSRKKTIRLLKGT